LALLSKREYSVAQLRHKLLLKGHFEPEISALIGDLIQRGWLDESRFVDCTIRARLRKGIGPLRLHQELQQKGIAKPLIQESEEWAAVEWEKVAEAAYLKKYQQKSIDTLLESQKRARFLVSRGFDPGLAWKIVRNHSDDGLN
jgi:regulatory protein